MTEPDYTRIVESVNISLYGEPDWAYVRYVEPEAYDSASDESYSGCESCWSMDREPRDGVLIYGTQIYDDPELTVRQHQTGGDIALCGDCIGDSIIEMYQSEPDFHCFVIPADYGDRTVRSYGGC